MTPLYPFLPFDPAETPLSYAARLARFHIGGRLLPFLRDVSIAPEDLAGGSRDAVMRLAEVSGVPFEQLARNAPVRIGKRLYDLRGEQVSAEFLSRPATVFCPACLREDDATGARKGRWPWALAVVRTCPDHGVPLVRQGWGAWGDDLHEMEVRVPERGAALDALAERQGLREVSPLQNYVMARLAGRAGPAWLDSQTLDQAVRTSELLGTVVEFGVGQKLVDMTPDQWDRAGRTGFAFASLGETGIRAALQQIHDRFDARGSAPGPQKILGTLYTSVAQSKSGKDPGDLARILREFVFDPIPLPDGYEIMGEPLARRRLHTVASLAEENALDRRTLRNVLVSHGLVPKDAHARFPFDAEAGRRIAASVKRKVTVISLPKALACTRPLVDQLFSEGLLHPLVESDRQIRGRTGKAVDLQDVERLIARLHKRATSVHGTPDGLVGISKAANKIGAPAVEIVHLILGGFLDEVARVETETGIAALRVNPAEIRPILEDVMAGLSPRAAFAALKIPHGAGWALTHPDPGAPKLECIRIPCPDPGHEIVRYRPDDIAAFKSTFTTVARIAEVHEMQIKHVWIRLKHANVRPIVRKPDIGVELVRTADLPEDLQV